MDFRNTILIMTSNVGSREMEEYGNGLGYATASKDLSSSRKSILEKSIRKVFPPEFINRIDERIQFNPLGREDMERIIDIELKDLRRRVAETGYRLNITPSAKKLVAEEGYDPKFGARPLKRAIQKYIENPVSEYIISVRRHGGGDDGIIPYPDILRNLSKPILRTGEDETMNTGKRIKEMWILRQERPCNRMARREKRFK